LTVYTMKCSVASVRALMKLHHFIGTTRTMVVLNSTTVVL